MDTSSWWKSLTAQCTSTHNYASDMVTCSPRDVDNFEEPNSFLVEHRPDRPTRHLVDPDAAAQAIQYQGDEMMKRDYRAQMNEDQLQEAKQSLGRVPDDEAAFDDEFMSTVNGGAPLSEFGTDITTQSVATRVAGNLDRYSSVKPKYTGNMAPRRKNSFPIMKPISEQNEEPGLFDLKGRFQSKSESHDKWEENVNSDVIKSRQRQKQSFKRVVEANGGCTICLGDSVVTIKEEYYQTLNLKMTANLAYFYRTSFLPLFPDAPIPLGMQRRTPWPNLTRTSTGSTMASQVTPERAANFGTSIPSSPVKFMVDGSPFMDLAITGSLGLVERGPTQVTPTNGNLKNPEHYLVLINRHSGVPLAVCAIKSHYGPPIVRIYATKHRVFGQRAAATTGGLGLWWSKDYPLFAWAEFTAEGEFPMPVRYSMFMSAGSDGRFEKEPSYKGSHRPAGSPEIVLVGKTETEEQYQGCGLLTLQTDEFDDTDTFFSLSLSRGIDPALMICFAAIVDETMEKTMRLQCDVHRQKCRRARRSGGSSRTSSY